MKLSFVVLTDVAPADEPLLGYAAALAAFVAHVSGGVEDAAALRAVQNSGPVDGLPIPELRGYTQDDYAEGVLDAGRDTRADLVVVFARHRSYLSEVFHRSAA